jgi:predicted nucleic acid-binding protein
MSPSDSPLVLDASVAIAWCFEDEASPQTEAIADRVSEDGALVPALWPLEVANVLVQAESRGRITPADVTARLELLGTLPIEVDWETAARAFREILALARSARLTTYDAAYLELALRRGAALATRDADLAKAARARGVEVLG